MPDPIASGRNSRYLVAVTIREAADMQTGDPFTVTTEVQVRKLRSAEQQPFYETYHVFGPWIVERRARRVYANGARTARPWAFFDYASSELEAFEGVRGAISGTGTVTWLRQDYADFIESQKRRGALTDEITALQRRLAPSKDCQSYGKVYTPLQWEYQQPSIGHYHQALKAAHLYTAALDDKAPPEKLHQIKTDLLTRYTSEEAAVRARIVELEEILDGERRAIDHARR